MNNKSHYRIGPVRPFLNSYFKLKHLIELFKKYKLTGAVALHGVPNVAVEVVVAGEEQPSRLAERHRGDSARDVVVAVHHQLLVAPDVEQPAGGVVAARSERLVAGKHL